ncbi:MAG TPA: hypothetical protein DEP57_09450 [Selenomonas sp.]|nr:hypothetical protein [Selenomonas sp.]
MKVIAGGGVIGLLLLFMAAAWGFSQQTAVMAQVEQKAADMASEALGTEVSVGAIDVTSTRGVTIHDIVLYDKNAQCIAKVEKAEAHFHLLSMLQDPAAAVDEVIIHGGDVLLAQREDGSWNLEDIKTSSDKESSFRGSVKLEDCRVTGRLKDGKEIFFDSVNGEADLSDYPEVAFKAASETEGVKLSASGTVSADRQIVHMDYENVDIMKYLSFLPQGTLPEGVTIMSGNIQRGALDIMNRDDILSLSGHAVYAGGGVKVLDTEIKDIRGRIMFTDKEAYINNDAEANGQSAHIQGNIRWDTESPSLKLTVSSDAFAPKEIMRDIPIDGTASFKARIIGTVKAPVVDGVIEADSASVYDIRLDKLYAHVRYVDDVVYVDRLRAGIWDGKAVGEVEFHANDMSYIAHVKAEGIQAANIAAYLPEAEGVSGLISADLGLNGEGKDFSKLTIYGGVSAVNGSFMEIPVERLDTSFFARGDNITVDYLSVNMPNKSSIGLEGTLQNGRILNMAFYGGHVDLSLFSHLLPEATLSGLSDFRGSVRGDAGNPMVEVDFSALKGNLFHQPYDSIKAKVSGNLDGIGIDTYQMEKDGRDVWYVMGSVGFTGERRVDLRVDTVGARMEDIMALVAPDQPLTGNVDNTIRITGTIDKPHMVGYIHFTRGSYRGILLSGMDGDYYVEGNDVKLQDFHIYSPMVDMDVNGTLNRVTTNIDMTVSVHDINMKRFQHKLPYAADGHGNFVGKIGGTLDEPLFDGMLNADELVFNEVVMKGVHGHVAYDSGWLVLRDFSFLQGEGRYDIAASCNLDSGKLVGNVKVQNVEINELCALANQKNDLLEGSLTSNIRLGGTLENPSINMDGSIPKGAFAGHDIHDINLDLNLINRVLSVNRLSGLQGATGIFQLEGAVSLDGPIELGLSAQNLALGMFTKAASVDTDVTGTADIEARIGGILSNPSADVELLAKNGGVKGATFDTMTGSLELKNGLIDVKELVVRKSIAERTYQASAVGIVPLRALTANESSELDEFERIKLRISLDDADLSLLPGLSKYVEWAIGETDGNLEVTGTLAYPLINGSFVIPDGSAKIRGIDNPIQNIRADVVFTGDEVSVREFSGNMGKGSYIVKGGMKFPGLRPTYYDLYLNADQLDVKSDFYDGPFSLELRLAEGEIYGYRMPKLTGNVTIDDCEISFPTIPDSDSELPDFILDVGVSLGKDAHFYTSYLYDLYLSGDLHFGGTLNHPKSSGTLTVARGGTINYLKRVFNIREGEAHFDQVASFLPSIRFFADTKLSDARVFLSMNGPLDKLQFKLTSSPEMSESDIIQLLTFGSSSKTGNGGVKAGDLLLVGLEMGFLSEVEDMIRKSLFVDTFTISKGSGSAFYGSSEDGKYKNAYNIQVGKYVTDKLMLKYARIFNGRHHNRYGVQYDFNDNVGASVEREGKDYIVGFEARFKF